MRQDPLFQVNEKNRILLDRLFKSEKQLEEMRQTIDTLQSGAESQKDKKIVELIKKNKALSLSNEGLKTKAAKAAEFALEMKKENDLTIKTSGAPPLKDAPV